VNSKNGAFRSELLLLLTAAIWGFAFVAQRAGMGSIGPFAFNAARYLLGSLSLLPLILVRRRAARRALSAGARSSRSLKRDLGYPLLAGSIIFMGASLQQYGLVTTTAGNAAFITSLYVVLVPLIGTILGRRVGPRGWSAAALAVAGLYLITVGGTFRMVSGDLYELAGALFWTLHILVIGRLAGKTDPVELSAGQFLVCAVLSFGCSFVLDPPFPAGSWSAALAGAALPILYGGVLSCGVAFTLQIVAQRTARPSHASIILALEGLFGAIGGILILAEPLTSRLAFGGLLMLSGAVLSQFDTAGLRTAKRKNQATA
jgi:drug/metabolite transporter (DMT)-like permease